jgi:hypothetical protein
MGSNVARWRHAAHSGHHGVAGRIVYASPFSLRVRTHSTLSRQRRFVRNERRADLGHAPKNPNGMKGIREQLGPREGRFEDPKTMEQNRRLAAPFDHGWIPERLVVASPPAAGRCVSSYDFPIVTVSGSGDEAKYRSESDKG